MTLLRIALGCLTVLLLCGFHPASKKVELSGSVSGNRFHEDFTIQAKPRDAAKYVVVATCSPSPDSTRRPELRIVLTLDRKLKVSSSAVTIDTIEGVRVEKRYAPNPGQAEALVARADISEKSGSSLGCSLGETCSWRLTLECTALADVPVESLAWNVEAELITDSACGSTPGAISIVRGARPRLPVEDAKSGLEE